VPAPASGDSAGGSLVNENPPAKYGVYADDMAVFDWMRAGSPEGRPCIEAQVMDWCDDVAYSVHDLEDGVQIGAIDLKLLHLPAARVEVFATTRALYSPGVPDDEIGAALDRLLDRSWWPQSYDGSRRDLAVLKNLTSHLVGRFCSTAEAATRGEYGPGPLTRHSADLIVPRPTRLEVAVLKGIAAHYVMFVEERRPRLDEERALLTELVDAIVTGAPASMEPPFQADWAEAPDDSARLRVAVDQVASLTDVSARDWHRRLRG
jgi:dGTPase